MPDSSLEQINELQASTIKWYEAIQKVQSERIKQLTSELDHAKLQLEEVREQRRLDNALEYQEPPAQSEPEAEERHAEIMTELNRQAKAIQGLAAKLEPEVKPKKSAWTQLWQLAVALVAVCLTRLVRES